MGAESSSKSSVSTSAPTVTDTEQTFRPPQHLPAWTTLRGHADRLKPIAGRSLFANDPGRVKALVLDVGALHADFSKQRIDAATVITLLQVARESRLEEGVRSLFDGERVNFTEQRAAAHMALRGGCAAPNAKGADTHAARRFVGELLRGALEGATGATIRHLVNIGIGGSDLGPRLAAEALTPISSAPRLKVDFVANIDPRELDEVLARAEPASTLFVISSKSFSTAETLANAEAARHWLRAGLGESADLSRHFAAVSNAVETAAAFGVAADRVFPLPEWVGGRYSVWSAIGLPLMAAIGEAEFDAFLAGARAMDAHFRDTPLERNLPVWMGLVGLWNTDFLGFETLGILPYAHGLRNFPAWLQQLEMESNGKRTLRDGSTTAVATSPIVWGGVGTVGQHAFHQLFYQGTRGVPLDFIVPVGDDSPRQRGLVDNALAQAAALMAGRDIDTARTALRHRGMNTVEVERLAPYLVSPGKQPSTTLLMPQLDAFHLGQLMALYEHKVFVQGWIWGINSFDQYGVELGKDMARALASGEGAQPDASTANLMEMAEVLRQKNRPEAAGLERASFAE